MAEQTFETFIQKERERLSEPREDVLSRRVQCEQELADIDKELTAISAYETVKAGKAPRATRTGTGKRRSGQRDAVLAEIKKHTDGIGRAELLKAMGVKGDKSGSQSVSNALAALKKAGTIGAKDGKYLPQ